MKSTFSVFYVRVFQGVGRGWRSVGLLGGLERGAVLDGCFVSFLARQQLFGLQPHPTEIEMGRDQLVG